jgi:hypothetical protein
MAAHKAVLIQAKLANASPQRTPSLNYPGLSYPERPGTGFYHPAAAYL